MDASFKFFQRALDLQAYRQQLLAGNIANADTPHYKAVDINFEQTLANAAQSQGQLPLMVTAAAHIAPPVQPEPAQTLYRLPLQPSQDGNTVEMDVERSKFADNAIHYEASLAFMNQQIKTMLAAIQG